MARRKDTLTLSVPQGTKEQLERLAAQLDIYWGQQPSPSGLVTAISEGRLAVGPGFRLSPIQIQALEQAVRALADVGLFAQARTVVDLLIDRGDLNEPQRKQLFDSLNDSPKEGWRDRIDQQIEVRQPFELYYKDAHGQHREFRVHHARIRFEERHSYLEIWTEETEGNRDIPELAHNWTLRLDRVQYVRPFTGEWRDDLDHITAKIRLSADLAAHYESRLDDVNATEDGDALLVTRKVYSSFNFLRNLHSYGAQCELLSPPALRERLIRSLDQTRAIYGA